MTRLEQADVARVLSCGLAGDAARAPGGTCETLLERAGAWAGISAACLQEPEDTRQMSDDLLSNYAATGQSYSVAEPAGIYRLKFHGELIALPDGFHARLAAAKSVQIEFRRACGGNGLPADEMVSALESRGVPVVAVCHEFAASAHGELFALSPGRRCMTTGAKLMLHAARSMIYGTTADLRNVADAMEARENLFAERLAKRTGRDFAEVRGWIAPGTSTWFDAEQAVAAGLADEILPS